MTLHEAYEVLGLPREAKAAQVKAAYRRLIAEAHPDRGGQVTAFIRVRAAYEILWTFLQQGIPEGDLPVPPDLREVIDAIVSDFREQQRWAEQETQAHMTHFERRMTDHINKASRADLRRFSDTFAAAWDATVGVLFTDCNNRCDGVMQRYEAWYTKNTQALFDDMYRKELLRFAWRRRFWEVFLILGAIAGALSVAVGWGGPWRRWVSVAMLAIAAGVSFLAYRRWARRRRKVRERVKPLDVVVFELDKGARFPAETALRRGRLTTTALGLAGMFLGNAASGGLALPVVGAVAGTAVGGALDRFLNPTERLRASMLKDLHRFVEAAGPSVTAYVLDAHARLLTDVRDLVLQSYQERAQQMVELLTSGTPGLSADRSV